MITHLTHNLNKSIWGSFFFSLGSSQEHTRKINSCVSRRNIEAKNAHLSGPYCTFLLWKKCKSSKQEKKVKPFEFPRTPFFFFSKTKTVIEILPSERAVWGERLFSALQGGGGGCVCLCVYVQLLQSMQERGRERKYQSVHGLNKQHYAGCCRLEGGAEECRRRQIQPQTACN